MPNLQRFRDNHFEASQKVSQLIQTLSLSGLAIVWLFHNKNEKGIYQIPIDLFWPLFLFILCLFIDFIQHLSKTLIWHYIYLHYETKLDINSESEPNTNGINETSELYTPNWVNYVPYFLFYSKSVVIFIAYILTLVFVGGSLSFSVK